MPIHPLRSMRLLIHSRKADPLLRKRGRGMEMEKEMVVMKIQEVSKEI